MNKLGIGSIFSRQNHKEVRYLMNLSQSLLHSCTLAAPPLPSSTTNTISLNLRHPPPPPSFHHHSFVRMSSTNTSITGTPQQQMSNTGDVSVNSAADLDSIFKQKKIIRSKVRKSLKEMDPAQRSLEDDAIQRIVLNAPWFKSSRRLCAYISCRSLREVDTSKVLAEILQISDKDSQKVSTKTLYVPRVEDKNSHMQMLNISGMEDLIANSMEILEPAPVDNKGNQREDVMRASEPVDLLLLPGLAFDRAGRRLGRGGGYYDTFLRNYQQLANQQNWKQPLLVALSYSPQILDDGVIPITPNDVYIDALVTPSGVIPISSAAHQRIEHGM